MRSPTVSKMLMQHRGRLPEMFRQAGFIAVEQGGDATCGVPLPPETAACTNVNSSL